jgi:hypothetical protein
MTYLSVCAAVLEQIVEWKYGVVASVALGLLAAARKADKTATLTCVSLVVVALLLAAR